MGRLAKLLSFVRTTRNGAKVSDVKVDPGGGPNVTGEHFSAPGDDSFPLANVDFVVTEEIAGTGREVVVGYVDPVNTPKATAGDKRVYARDATTGAVVGELWLKSDKSIELRNDLGVVLIRADGSIRGSNPNGSFELEVDGDFVVNGVTIAADGSVTIPTSLTLNGKEIAEHDHPITSGSSAPGPTGPNN